MASIVSTVASAQTSNRSGINQDVKKDSEFIATNPEFFKSFVEPSPKQSHKTTPKSDPEYRFIDKLSDVEEGGKYDGDEDTEDDDAKKKLHN